MTRVLSLRPQADFARVNAPQPSSIAVDHRANPVSP
jgi:hypothetical protein